MQKIASLLRLKCLAAPIAIAFVAGCTTPVGLREVGGCGAVESVHIGKSPDETIEAFTRSDLETKYRIYVCGNQWVHPPALYLAGSFAVGGEPVATFLKQKLEQTRSDATVRDIVQVYAQMQRQRTYDVSGDLDLVQLLTNKVQAIRNDDWRKYCADILEGISNV